MCKKSLCLITNFVTAGKFIRLYNVNIVRIVLKIVEIAYRSFKESISFFWGGEGHATRPPKMAHSSINRCYKILVYARLLVIGISIGSYVFHSRWRSCICTIELHGRISMNFTNDTAVHDEIRQFKLIDQSSPNRNISISPLKMKI